MLLNPSMVTNLLHSPPFLAEGSLESKTTTVLKYISDMADFTGKIFACVSVEFLRQ
jgi:hypothetical protein